MFFGREITDTSYRLSNETWKQNDRIRTKQSAYEHEPKWHLPNKDNLNPLDMAHLLERSSVL